MARGQSDSRGKTGSMWLSRRSCLAVTITVLQIQGLICVKTTYVTGMEGQMFHFRCEYPKGWEDNAKYFSHVDDSSSSHPIRTDQHDVWVKDGRFSLYDNTSGAFFVVKLDALSLIDSGTYWCGVDIILRPDLISVIKLNVSKANLMSASTTHPKVNKLTLQLFLAATLCIAAIVFVCLFTFCLLMVVKQRRSSQRQKKQTSSDYETVTAAVKMETAPDFICTDPHCPYRLGGGPSPTDLYQHVTSKHRRSTVSLGFGDYVDIDVSRPNSHYQQLNLQQQEEHVYSHLHGNGSPKPGHRVH